MPGFTVALADQTPGGTTTAQAEIPAWTFGVSPLREVQTGEARRPGRLPPADGRARRLDPEPATFAALGFAGLALPALGLLAWDRAWLGRRRGRPFARAAGACASSPRQGRGGYREALRLIHRGLDETDGRRLLADDLRLPRPAPRLPGEGEALARFFAASRRASSAGRSRPPGALALACAASVCRPTRRRRAEGVR